MKIMEAQAQKTIGSESTKLKLTNGLNYEVPFQVKRKTENPVRSTFGIKKG